MLVDSFAFELCFGRGSFIALFLLDPNWDAICDLGGRVTATSLALPEVKISVGSSIILSGSEMSFCLIAVVFAASYLP